MLARAILVLSLLLCTRALAQAPVPVPVQDARPSEPAAAGDSAAADGAAQPSASGGVGPQSAESVKSAVPVDRQALLPPAAEPAKHDLESDPMFTPAVVLIGTGTAALLASLFTGLGAHGIYKSLEEDCRNNLCSSDKEQRINSGKALAVVSTVLTGAGIAAAGVGATLLILAAKRDDQPTQPANFGLASLQLTGGPTPLGLGAQGSF